MKSLVFLSLFVATCAIEQPEKFLRQKSLQDESHRELLSDFERQLAKGGKKDSSEKTAKGGKGQSSERETAGACGARLSICEAVTQDMDFPAEKWIGLLEGMGGDRNDTLVGDLVQLITLSQSADFYPVVSTVQSSANAQTVLTVIRDTVQEIKGIDQADPTGATAVMVDALTRVETVLTAVGSPVPERSIDLVIFLLTFTAGLLNVIGGAPIEIVIYIVSQIIIFVTTFLAGLFTVAVFPSADAECQSELMLCNYVKMMLDIVPGLVGSIFIAETLA